MTDTKLIVHRREKRDISVLELKWPYLYTKKTLDDCDEFAHLENA